MLNLLNLGSRGGPAGRIALAWRFVDAFVRGRPVHVELVVTHDVRIEQLTAWIDTAHRLGAPQITLATPIDYPELELAVAHAARRARVVVRMRAGTRDSSDDSG